MKLSLGDEFEKNNREKQNFSAVVTVQCTEIQTILKDVVERPLTGKSCLQNDNIEFVKC